MENRLTERRAVDGWSQTHLADLLGVRRQTVNALEKGRYDPCLPLAFRLARVFSTTIEDSQRRRSRLRPSRSIDCCGGVSPSTTRSAVTLRWPAAGAGVILVSGSGERFHRDRQTIVGSVSEQARLFSSEHVATLLEQFDVTRPEEPAAAEEYCEALRVWIEACDSSTSSVDLDKMRADLWFMEGMLCDIRGDLDGAIEQLQRSIAHSEQIGYARRHILGLRSIAMCFENAGMQTESTACISEALDLAHAHGDDRDLALVSLTLSRLYQAQGAWGSLFDSSMRTCEIADRVGEPHLMSRAYSGLAIAFGHELRIDEGLEWIDRALAIIADCAFPLERLYLDLNRWFLFRKAGRVDESAAIAERLVETIDTLPSADAARLAVQIAETRLNVGDLDGAQEMLLRSEDTARGTQLTAHLIAYHEVSAKLHEARNDHERALASLRRQLMVERELWGGKAQTRLVAVERRFERELSAQREEIHQLRNIELVAKNDQLAALNHQKDEILNVVAHDLRNPLAAAQMMCDSLLIDADHGMSPDGLDQLTSMRAATSEMGATIDSLLHLQSGISPRHLSTVDDVVARSLAWVAGPASERQIGLKCDITPVVLNVDGALLRRSLDDVLWMEVQSVAPGGAISVSVRPHGAGARITLVSRPVVSEPDDRQLYIARRLIERMGGSTTTTDLDQSGTETVIDLRGA